ncbi:MAG: DUF5615 family PIN-like protein [Nanoarchaeota archaeon]
MKFIADENIPLEVVEILKRKGIDIISLSLKDPGMKDYDVLNLSIEEQRTLITFDRDFSKLIFKLKKPNYGVIFLRMHPQSTEHIVKLLEKLFNMEIPFEESFCIVTLDRVRVIPI